MARPKGGVALREDVLRAEVQLSESREALVLARQVVSLSGDGGLAMRMGEFLTVARYLLPVKIVRRRCST